MNGISINREAMKLVRTLLANPDPLGVAVSRLSNGSTLIDMGQQVPGSWLAGKYYAEITMGGLGMLSFETFPIPINGVRLPAVRVQIDFPLLACVASQIAGWPLSAGDGAPILCGPARALHKTPDSHFHSIDYRDNHHEAVIAIQTEKNIQPEWAEQIADSCNVTAEHLYILVAPNNSLVCAIQVAARSVEQAIHRLEEEGLPLATIQSAHGFAVLPPLVEDDLVAMGRINDALLYGAEATFQLRYPDDPFLADLAQKVVSTASSVYGHPFAQIYLDAGRDFYKIPLTSHSPAVVHLNNMVNGRTHSAGHINETVLAASFFGISGDFGG